MNKTSIDKNQITVTMNMEQFEYYTDAAYDREHYLKILERANQDGKAVMTEELKTAIEEIYL